MTIVSQPVKRIAVLLAAYNGVPWLDEQIESILRQRNVDLRLFISVDQSQDGTEALVDRWAGRDTRIECLPHGQRFGSAARNFFRLLRDVDVSSFAYVCFADQDDIWNPDKLEHCADTLESQRAGGISTNVVAFWPDGREVLIRKNQPIGAWNHLFESAGPGCTYLVRASLARSLGSALRRSPALADRIALHDWLVFAWVRAHGERWWIDPVPTMRYRQHGANEFGANRGLGAAATRWRKLFGGWYRMQVLAVAEFVGQREVIPVRRLARLGLLDRLFLSTAVASLRRRWRDRWVLVAALLLMRT